MTANEEDTHRRVNTEVQRLVREIEKAHGHVFSFAGDGLMAEFPSAVAALKCALRIQADAGRRNAKLAADRQIMYRIGLNSGEVVVQNGRAGGHAVNVAARLEQIADPGGVFLSRAVVDQVRPVVTALYEPVGQRRLKNIREPVDVYRIPADSCRSWSGAPALPRQSHRAIETATDYRPSLAVLPFRTQQIDQSDAYFAEGIVDDIIRVLSGLKELLVVARTSTLGFARSPVDLRSVGHDLDVRYVLHGSVRRAGEALRIAVELSEAETGHVMWADRFDGPLSDLFELQDRIAFRVAGAIAPKVRDLELSRAMRMYPASMTAYDLLLQGLDRLHRMDRPSFFLARDLMRDAIAADPNYAPAHSHTAYWHLTCVGQGWSQDPDADTQAAANAARAAIDLDPNDATALAFYGQIQGYLMKNHDSAAGFLDRALAAGPSCAWAWTMSSFARGWAGDAVTALARAEQAVRLSPRGPDAYYHEHALAQAHYLCGNHQDAAAWGRMSVSRNNGAQTSNLRTLAVTLVALGELDEARQVGQRLLQWDPSFRLATFRARTPLRGTILDHFVERLRVAGLPD
jgi:TolB-like protein/Tfp pilus assembly protein PilF